MTEEINLNLFTDYLDEDKIKINEVNKRRQNHENLGKLIKKRLIYYKSILEKSNKYHDQPMSDETIKNLADNQTNASIIADIGGSPVVEFTRGYSKKNGYYEECALGIVKYPKPSKDLLYDP